MAEVNMCETGDTVDGLFFSRGILDRVAARNDPKCPVGWHVQYAARVKRDFAEIKPWLPRDAGGRVIDIGCGYGGVDAYLGGWMGKDSLKPEAFFTDILLIDGCGWGRREGGFHSRLTPWNDVGLAADLVRENVMEYDCEVTTASVPPIPEPWPADLIISLKSWGHHYPVDSYLDFVRRSLMPGGRVILDVRKNTSGRQVLEAAGFKYLGRAGGTIKTDRLVFQGPA